MAVAALSLLEEIHDLRTVWPHEALDFTRWLAEDENMSLLSDAIGLDLTAEETESDVGNFSADILATETGSDRKVIIENQLEDSNHDHLGKLITYASGKSAQIVIWLVKRAREEHRSAIEWLNNHTDEDIGFFLCEIKLYRIGNSDPAVKFEVIERPNDWARGIRSSGPITPARQSKLDYWTNFNQYASQRSAYLHAFHLPKPSMHHWMDLSIGSSACHLAMSQIRKRGILLAELYINDNKELFHYLLEHRSEIEAIAGISLEWRELPRRKASRIVIERPANFSDSALWPEQFDWLMNTTLKLKSAFTPYL